MRRIECRQRNGPIRFVLGLPVVFVLILPVWTALACGDPSDASLDGIVDRGFLRAGFADEPPYAFVDEEGRIRGESPAVLHAAAGGLGIPEVRWVLLDFGELIPALESGRIDVIAAGMFRTPERMQQVGFTLPTYCADGALLVARHNPLGLHGLADLPERGAVLAVLYGSVEERAAQILDIPEDQLLAVPDSDTAFEAVLAGNADALALTAPTARYLAARAPDRLELARPFEPSPEVEELLGGCGSFAVRRNDRELRAALDGFLRSFVGSERHLQLVAPFGFAAREVTAAADAGDALGGSGPTPGRGR